MTIIPPKWGKWGKSIDQDKNIISWKGRLDTSGHDDVIKWKHFPGYWSFVRGIHRSPVNSPHKGQWHRALMFSLICVWINGWVNNREAGDLGCYRAHYDVTITRLILSHSYHAFLRKSPKPPKLTCFTKSKWHQNGENQQTMPKI